MTTTRTTVLTCEGLSHSFGRQPVLHNVNLDVHQGDIVALVGPSGCGKSTLLRAILGTDPTREGRVLLHGRAVVRPSRDIGIVYQHYSLFPFLTAIQNVAFGLMLDETTFLSRMFRPLSWRRKRRQHLEQAAAMLDRVGLAHAYERYPRQLSGGMQQRVALAQALIMKPTLLVLDEPFGALDEATRESLQDMLLELYAENCTARATGVPEPYSIMLVTHELNEALYVSNRVIGLSQYWDYEKAGYSANPGSTIVYDEASPIFTPNQPRNTESLRPLRNQIRACVFGAHP